jgi:hypothetical protein
MWLIVFIAVLPLIRGFDFVSGIASAWAGIDAMGGSCGSAPCGAVAFATPENLPFFR